MSASAGGGGGSAAAGGGGGSSGAAGGGGGSSGASIIITADKITSGFDYLGFHIADTLKDAKANKSTKKDSSVNDDYESESKEYPSITMKNKLFSQCLVALYTEKSLNKVYNSKDYLKDLHVSISSASTAQKVPVNRLRPIQGGKEETDIPSRIKYVIRDNAGIAKHIKFSSDIKILGNIADYTDSALREPASRIAGSVFFPEVEKEMHIHDNVFIKLLGRKIITNFIGIIHHDYSCTVSFFIYGIPYTANIDKDHAQTGDTSKYMTGNGDKNIWFNTINEKINNTKGTYDISKEIQEGILYLICKEFFGDVLQALVGLSFKDYSHLYGGQAAVFTGDGPLASLCIHLNINVVSLLRDKETKTSECMAYLFADDEKVRRAERISEKRSILYDIIKKNELHMEKLQSVINKLYEEGGKVKIVSMREDFEAGSERANRLAEFLGHITLIIQKNINMLQSIIIEDNSETGHQYRLKMTHFHINTIIESRVGTEGGGFIIDFSLNRSLIPEWILHEETSEFDILLKDPTPMIEKIKNLLSPRPSRRGQRGGGLAPMKGGNFSALKKEYAKGNGMQYDPFNLDEELKNPTAYLRKVINEVLTKHRPAIRLTGSASYEGGGSELVYIDDLDVYELLYPIYEVSGTINYDPNFILFAINAYLVSYSPEAPSLMEFYHTEILKVPFPSSSKPVPRVGTPIASPATSKKRPLERNEYIEENEVRHLPPGYRPRTPPKKTAYAGGRRGKRITRKKVNYKRKTRR